MSKAETGYNNHYRHVDCPKQPGIEWNGQWSCMCNDRCPACNAEIEPHTSELDGTRTQAELDAFNRQGTPA